MSALKHLSDYLKSSPLNYREITSAPAELIISVAVKARPGAKLAQVKLGSVGELLVWVNARPVVGAANEAIRLALASAFGVSKGQVALDKGEKGRQKQFTVCFRKKDNQPQDYYLKKAQLILESV